MPDDVTSLRIRVLSEDVEKAHRRLEALERQGTETERAVDRMGKTSSVSFGKILAGVASVTAVGAATGAAVRQWLDYDKAMKEVLSITSLSRSEFGALREDVLRLSASLGVDATVAAKGLYQALSAGVPQENVLEFMEVASKSAIAGVTEVNVAVDGLTNVINAYHMEAGDAMEVSDKLFAAVVDGKTTFEELAGHMSKASVIAASLDVPFEQLLASIISITKQGTQTSEAFTQMKAVFTALVRPTEDMALAYERLGIQSGRQAIAQHGLAGALQLVRNSFGSNDAALVKALGSTEAYNGVLSVTGTNLATFERGLENVNDSVGKTNKAFEDNSNTLGYSLRQLKNTFIGFVEELESSTGIIQNTSNLLRDLAQDLRLVAGGMGEATINSSRNFGGITGVNILQDAIADLESQRTQLEAAGASLQRLQEGREKYGRSREWLTSDGGNDMYLAQITGQLAQYRQELAKYDAATIHSAELQRDLAAAVNDGNAEAEAAIRAKIDAQEQLVASAQEEADILEEVSELEKLLQDQKVKMADEQLKKDEASAKLRKKEAQEEARETARRQKEANDLATTEREKLELKIKQLEVDKERGVIEPAIADRAIATVRQQIVEYEKLAAKKAEAAGSGGGGSDLSLFGNGLDNLFNQLLSEEEMIEESYLRQREIILSSTKLTEEQKLDLLARAQQDYMRQMDAFNTQANQDYLDAYTNLFTNLETLGQAFGKKGFAIAKAAAIANATVSGIEAAIHSFKFGAKIGGPPVGAAFAAISAAATGAQIATIAATEYAGAYATGGMIPSGHYGLVGEAGPEFVRGPAVVTSKRATEGLMSGSDKAPTTNVIINNFAGAEVTTRQEPGVDGKTVNTIVDIVLDRTAKEIHRGGNKISKALESVYPINRGRRTA